MKNIKDWTMEIAGLEQMDIDPLTNLYSEMLATAHDIGYQVPDELLVETENPEELRKVIVPLHEGIKTAHAEAKAAAKETEAAKPPKKTVAKKAATKAPKKPAKSAEQKEAKKETTMTEAATTTAKKAAPKKAAAKKAAPKGKAAKKTSKKASAANARTPAGRYTGDEVITVKVKENPAREGTGKFDRMANLIKHNGKTVAAFLKTALGKSSTLRNAVNAGWISVK